jgi:hypothetical protein
MAAVACAAVLVLGERGATARRAAPDLSGEWTLNRDLSTAPGVGAGVGAGDGRGRGGPGGGGGRPGGRMGSGRGGGGRGPGGGMPGGRGGGGGAAPSREDMEARRALMAEVVTLPARWTITQDGDRVVFVEPDGVVRTYVANGAKEKHQLTNGTIETASAWDGPRLRMSISAGGRATLVRTFELKSDPRRLEVTTTGERAPKDAKQVSVYDPADAGQ